MTTDTVGGVWTYTVELARGLSRQGVEVWLAAMGGALSREQRAEAASLPVCESRYKLEWMERPWPEVARAGEWLLAVAARCAPEAIHLNQFAHGSLPWPAPVLVVGHSCVLSWWEAVRGGSAPPEWDRYREAVGDGLRAAACVAAPSQAMLEALARHYGPLRRTRVVYNGREPARFVAEAKEPLVFAAGRLWDEAKNLPALDRAAEGLAWPICVAGETRHPAGGAARMRHARALGHLGAGEVARWMARASIYALPARYEPFGLSILEAALSGCALVLGDIASLREIWDDAAVWVPPQDEHALAAALDLLIRDQALRGTMAARARARAQRYTAESMVRDYLALYAEMLAGKEAAPAVC